jgi:hypothetical protein
MDNTNAPGNGAENRLDSEVEAALRAAIAASSQAKVAKKIGYSASTLSQVLNGTYGGNLTKFEQCVRGALLSETVNCPALGMEIKRNVCVEHQNRPQKFAMVNPMYIKLFRACPGCPFNIKRRETEE